MQVICVSKGTFSRGEELARLLAEKLGYACVSREELIEAAIKEGIQVGRLEMAMIKPRVFSERMELEKEHYRAFCTAYLCDRALEGKLVYHGRTGHLLLPGISHVLRVRVVADYESRIRAAMEQLRIDRDKARKYLEEVDEDWRRWVKFMYGISLEEPINYDITINLDQISVNNAAVALTQIAQLPDFQMTPASRKAMLDLRLAAHCRVALARDKRTYLGKFNVRASDGVVTVSYLPQDAHYAELIPAVLSAVPEVKEVRTTMAMTNILWVQERFDPQSETFKEVVDLATRWNAAVELVRLVPDEERPETAPARESSAEEPPRSFEETGGIEDDDERESEDTDDGGLKETLAELARLGRSGGGKTVFGDHRNLLGSLERNVPYTLVVVGDIFLSKAHAARLRAARDLISFLNDRMRVPVVPAEDLAARYLFTRREIFRTAVFAAVTALLYLLVFTHQEPILAFLAHAGWYAEAVKDSMLGAHPWMAKLLVSAAVFLFVPVVAYSYGNVTKAFLKLIKME